VTKQEPSNKSIIDTRLRKNFQINRLLIRD